MDRDGVLGTGNLPGVPVAEPLIWDLNLSRLYGKRKEGEKGRRMWEVSEGGKKGGREEGRGEGEKDIRR